MTAIIYLAAALAEIAGCFAFWAWLCLARSVLWLLPSWGSLVLFAYLLTLVDAHEAARAYPKRGPARRPTPRWPVERSLHISVHWQISRQFLEDRLKTINQALEPLEQGIVQFYSNTFPSAEPRVDPAA